MTTLLETRRLTLESWQDGDVALVHRLHSDPDNARFHGDGKPWNMARCRERLDEWRNEFARDGISKLKLVAREDGRFIGRAGFSFHPGTGLYEMGYSILRSEWGKGYASEIAYALAGWFFHHRHERRFTAYAHRDNGASLRVLEKIGMKPASEQVVDGVPFRFFEMAAPTTHML